MKKILLLFILISQLASAQWSVMQKFNEVGKGNYYLFVPTEKDAKRIIIETLHDNLLNYELTFNKGANLFLNTAVTDPLNHEYVYVVHCIKGNYQNTLGYHILCYYMENRYRYFYDVDETEGRIALCYDPAVNSITPQKPKK